MAIWSVPRLASGPLLSLIAVALVASGCSSPPATVATPPPASGAPAATTPATPDPTPTDEVDPTSRFGFVKQIGLATEPKPETRVLSAAEAAAIDEFTVLNKAECQSMSPDRPRCRFRLVLDPLPPGVRVGTVLNAGVTPATPYGFLVRITSIAGTTLLADEAALDEALAQGEMRAEQVFTSAQVRAVRTIAKVRPTGLPSTVTVGRLGSAVGEVALPQEVVDALLPGMLPSSYDFNNKTFGFAVDVDQYQVTDGLVVDGTFYFSFECGIDIGLTYKWKIIPNGIRFASICGGDQGAHATVTATKPVSASKEYVIAQYDLDPIIIHCYVTLVFIPTITITLNAKGEAKASMTYSADESIHAKAGLSYNKGWTKLWQFSADASHGTAEKSVSVTLEAGATVAYKLMLYGTHGTSQNTYAGLVFTAQIPRKPSWSLSLHAVGGVSFNVWLIIKELVAGPLNVFDETVGIAEAANEAPELTIAGLKDGQQVYAAGSVMLLPTYTVSAVDAEGDPITLSATSSVAGDLGAVQNGSPRTLSLPQTGTHVLTFRASDSEGATSTRTVTVTVVRPVPKLTVSLASMANVPIPLAGSGVSVTQAKGSSLHVTALFTAGVPGGTTPACSAVTWNAGGLTFTTNGSCSALLTLTKEGTFTVIVGGPAGVASTSFKVTVTPPPSVIPPEFDGIQVWVGTSDATVWPLVPYGSVTFRMRMTNAAATPFQPRYVWSMRTATSPTFSPLTAWERLLRESSSRTVTLAPSTTYVVRLEIFDALGSSTVPAYTFTKTVRTTEQVR